MNIIPANPGYKVLLAREHGPTEEGYVWYEAEDIVYWQQVEDSLLPVTLKHGAIDRHAKYPRYEGIVTPSGGIVTDWGTFSSIEDLRKFYFDMGVREKQGRQIMKHLQDKTNGR